ncbi:MAG TPA: carboxylesterase family protein [Rectinemataceae bacterium]|nr:carboxylesterase family protein [Rectinemataceae bacterium]
MIKKNSTAIAAGTSLLAVPTLIFLMSCASVPSPTLTSTFSPGEWEGGTTVRTMYGALEGLSDKANTYAWLGIPYAAPPIGDLRWQKPLPPEPWRGIRRAKSFGAKPVQRSIMTGLATGSEDCLFLNVWRPATGEKKLPVYVWIHGGANTSGSSDGSRNYRGHALASSANLVFVSVNYRLDVLGWFAHPALHTGDPETDSGNFGTLDLIAALGWVRDNIAAFGGDPGNVTIAGESAGALNVFTLLMAPKAKGLFHKAVAESGYTRQSKLNAKEFAEDLARRLAIFQERAATEKEANEFMASLGAQGTAKWLREAKPGELLKFSKSTTGSILSLPNPIFDGTLLPSQGFAGLSDPAWSSTVPLIVGTNKEETKLFLSLQGQSHRNPDYQKLADATTAAWKAEGADAVADALDSLGAERKVYVYRFDWGAPDKDGNSVMGKRLGAQLGAAHAIEVSFFLQTDSIYGNIFFLPFSPMANDKGRLDLQTKIGSYLANFVRTGNPNGEGFGATGELPYWKAWDAGEAQPSFLVLTADSLEAKIRTEEGRTLKSAVLLDIATEGSDSFKEKLQKVLPLLE